MRAVVSGQGKGPHLADVPEPTLAPGQILIETARTLISAGTELHYANKMLTGARALPAGVLCCRPSSISRAGSTRPRAGHTRGRHGMEVRNPRGTNHSTSSPRC